MAKHLARIHGTEEDKVNCPFYFKIGACRHADRCSRLHHRPAFSPTILIKHIYRHPVREAELRAAVEGVDKVDVISKDQAQEEFLTFFENMYEELGKFGRIEALHVCDNLGDHMIGHVYAKFSDEEEAADALNIMNNRFYDGRRMEVEFSPVTDFREARCRDYDEDTCSRGGFCNFMHVKPIPMCLIRSLEEDCEQWRQEQDTKRRDRRSGGSRNRPPRKRDRDDEQDFNDDDDRDRRRDDNRRPERDDENEPRRRPRVEEDHDRRSGRDDDESDNDRRSSREGRSRKDDDEGRRRGDDDGDQDDDDDADDSRRRRGDRDRDRDRDRRHRSKRRRRHRDDEDDDEEEDDDHDEDDDRKRKRRSRGSRSRRDRRDRDRRRRDDEEEDEDADDAEDADKRSHRRGGRSDGKVEEEDKD